MRCTYGRTFAAHEYNLLAESIIEDKSSEHTKLVHTGSFDLLFVTN